ncbi:MAG: tetratricopeptide (TPR) repeat protein, partial [Myxococcota bacterium]
RGLRYNNQNQEALAVLEELQGLVRASNDQSVLFAVYTNQNQVLARLGLIDEAIAVLWEAHTIACEGGRLDGQQSALRTIGTRYHLSGRSEEAIQPLQQALALDSEGYKPHVGLWLARALLRTGRTSEAREVCLEALRRARLLGLKNTEIQLLETLARFEDGESCIELMRQARALASAQQLDLVVANISVKTGLRLLGFGRPDEAAEMFDAAEARLRVGGRSFASIPIENHLRFGHASLLEVREEWEALVTVVEALMPNANPQIKEQISLMLAHALRKLGRETGRAERLARQALADAQHRGGLLSQVRGHIELGWHALLRGDSPQVHLDALTALMPGIVASQEQHLARKVASLRRAAEQ